MTFMTRRLLSILMVGSLLASGGLGCSESSDDSETDPTDAVSISDGAAIDAGVNVDAGADIDADPTTPDSAIESADFGPVSDAALMFDAAPVFDAAPILDAAIAPDGGESPPNRSTGCGRDAEHRPGGVYVEVDLGPEADGTRRFLLSIPQNYRPDVAHKLILGFAGRDAMGDLMQRYLRLERTAQPDEIFVYPDPLFRDFEGWGRYGGWLLGPHGHPAHGVTDLNFTRAIVEYVQERYCIDGERIFATGHSWGGDMSHVVACFLGDIFRAAVPVAANRPYWFEQRNGQRAQCEGSTAVWTFFGINDDAFLSAQSYPSEFGDLVRDFWVTEHGCEGVESSVDLALDPASTCVQYEGCDLDTRYCLYGPDTGHQIPPYYPETTMEWFRTF